MRNLNLMSDEIRLYREIQSLYKEICQANGITSPSVRETLQFDGGDLHKVSLHTVKVNSDGQINLMQVIHMHRSIARLEHFIDKADMNNIDIDELNEMVRTLKDALPEPALCKLPSMSSSGMWISNKKGKTDPSLIAKNTMDYGQEAFSIGTTAYGIYNEIDEILNDDINLIEEEINDGKDISLEYLGTLFIAMINLSFSLKTRMEGLSKLAEGEFDNGLDKTKEVLSLIRYLGSAAHTGLSLVKQLEEVGGLDNTLVSKALPISGVVINLFTLTNKIIEMVKLAKNQQEICSCIGKLEYIEENFGQLINCDEEMDLLKRKSSELDCQYAEKLMGLAKTAFDTAGKLSLAINVLAPGQPISSGFTSITTGASLALTLSIFVTSIIRQVNNHRLIKDIHEYASNNPYQTDVELAMANFVKLLHYNYRKSSDHNNELDYKIIADFEENNDVNQVLSDLNVIQQTISNNSKMQQGVNSEDDHLYEIHEGNLIEYIHENIDFFVNLEVPDFESAPSQDDIKANDRVDAIQFLTGKAIDKVASVGRSIYGVFGQAHRRQGYQELSSVNDLPSGNKGNNSDYSEDDSLLASNPKPSLYN